jgi:aquaporin-4
MFTLVVSIISCAESHNPDPQLLIPFVVFFIAFFLLAIFPLSGCHVNPLISFLAALKGVITPVRACVYMLGQCVGSIIGFLLIKSVMSVDAVAKYSLGGCTINVNGGGESLGTALMLEFVCSFLLLLLAMTVAFDDKRHKELGMPMICAVIAASMAIAVYVSIVVTESRARPAPD